MQVAITKDKTQVVKGFAILFMIAHHCLIKEFYIDSPEILNTFAAIRLQIGMKMCVGLFTFFVGYGFFYSEKVNIQYVVQRIWRLLKQYWIILAISLLIASHWGGGCGIMLIFICLH